MLAIAVRLLGSSANLKFCSRCVSIVRSAAVASKARRSPCSVASTASSSAAPAATYVPSL